MTQPKVQQPTDTEPITKRAEELMPGDWLGPDELKLGIPAEILGSYPSERDVLLVLQPAGQSPDSVTWAPQRRVVLASADEVAAAARDARRWAIARDLHQLADLLVEANDVPLPEYGIDIRFGDVPVDEAEALAEALNTEVVPRHSTSKQNCVLWPRGRKSYDEGVRATWDVEVHDTGLDFSREAEDTEPGHVPAGVDGQPVAGRRGGQ